MKVDLNKVFLSVILSSQLAQFYSPKQDRTILGPTLSIVLQLFYKILLNLAATEGQNDRLFQSIGKLEELLI